MLIRLICVLLEILLWGIQQGTAVPSWEKVVSATGVPEPTRGEFSMVANGTNAILYGGCNIAFDSFYNDVWVAKFAENNQYSWSNIKTFGEKPVGSCGHGAAVVKSKMYVFGGLVAGTKGNDLHVLDLKTFVWAKVVSDCPKYLSKRSLLQHSMVAYPDGFVVVGGTTEQQDDNSAYRFFVHNASWERISSGFGTMKSVGGPAAVQLNNTLLALGGFLDRSTTESFMYLESHQRYFHNVSWKSEGAPSLGSIAFAGAVAIKNRFMVVYGGFSMTAINPYVWVFRWDTFPSHGQWCKVMVQGASPEPHFAAGLVALGNRLYAFGGRIHPPGHNEELAADMWRLGDIFRGKCLSS